MTFLIKVCFYFVLAVLAYACIQTANSMSKESGKCAKVSLMLIIVGCASLAACAFYELSAKWLMLSASPLVTGISFWLIIGNAEIHHKLDKWMTSIKNMFVGRATTR